MTAGMPMTTGPFTLQRVTSIEWIVVDGSLDVNDPYRTIACIYEIDEFEYDVVWLRDLGLPTTYMSPADVLDDVRRTRIRRRAPWQKPIPIPHRAPVAAAGA